MNDNLKSALAALLSAARTELPREELPDFLAEIERVRALAWARLQAPVAAPHDELLDIDIAAQRLGLSKHYLYRHSKQFSFTRHQGRKLLFSAHGIQQHIQQQPRTLSLSSRIEK